MLLICFFRWSAAREAQFRICGEMEASISGYNCAGIDRDAPPPSALEHVHMQAANTVDKRWFAIRIRRHLKLHFICAKSPFTRLTLL